MAQDQPEQQMSLSRRWLLQTGAATVLLAASGSLAACNTEAPVPEVQPTSQPPTLVPEPTITSAPTRSPIIAKVSDLQPNSSLVFNRSDYAWELPALLVRRSDGSFVAYDASCTHNRCEVAYLAEAQQLRCPCHGARFRIEDGEVVRGPASAGLTRFRLRVDEASGEIIFLGVES